MVKDIPSSYVNPLNLIDNNIIQAKTIFRNTRMPISQIIFENTIATIYSVNLSLDAKLEDMVTVQNNLTDLNIDASVFTGMENYTIFNYDILHKQAAVEGVQISFLKNSKVEQFIKSDSALAYFIPKSAGFKIRYSGFDYNDVAVNVHGIDTFESKPSVSPVTNMVVVFRKIDKQLVIFILHKRNDEVPEIKQEAFKALFGNNSITDEH
jgi:hypothetical protein